LFSLQRIANVADRNLMLFSPPENKCQPIQIGGSYAIDASMLRGAGICGGPLDIPAATSAGG
jgi:hypothetical protein